MLHDHPRVYALLELLDDQPSDWRQYYEDLWERYPTLAAVWINVSYLNLPRWGSADDWDRAWVRDMYRRAEERARENAMILGKLRALAYGVVASRGKTRAAKSRTLDRRLAEFGLRPSFRGGARLAASELPKVRALYTEFREVIDHVRAEARDLGLEADAEAREALLIRFPFFLEDEFAQLFKFHYPRRGATADAAAWIVARRYRIPPATLNRYLFPR
jgi:hypothetical protein